MQLPMALTHLVEYGAMPRSVPWHVPGVRQTQSRSPLRHEGQSSTDTSGHVVNWKERRSKGS